MTIEEYQIDRALLRYSNHKLKIKFQLIFYTLNSFFLGHAYFRAQLHKLVNSPSAIL